MRNKVFTYEQAEKYFLEHADLNDELDKIQATKEVIESTGIARFFSCFKKRVRLNQNLSDERDLVFAIAKVRYDSRIAEHEIILKTIYKKLMQTDQCR